MPNRQIRPEILTSERVDKLGPHAEVFYRRLMSVVDDFGRFDARLGVLRAAVYPLRIDKVREADISRFLAEVQEAGLVVLYSVDGKQYLEMLNFGVPRAKESKFPSPCKHLRADANICAQTQTNVPYSYSSSISNSCSEDSSEPSKRRSKPFEETPVEDQFLEFPVVGNPNALTWWLTHAKANEYRQSYPGVNVDSEARKALQWLRDNKSKQKTAAGMTRFLNSWMGRVQNDGGTKQSAAGGGQSAEQKRFDGSLSALQRFAASDENSIRNGNGPPLRLEAND